MAIAEKGASAPFFLRRMQSPLAKLAASAALCFDRSLRAANFAIVNSADMAKEATIAAKRRRLEAGR